MANGYATIGTDGGNDNATNSVAASGGQYAFGVDNQARVDYWLEYQNTWVNFGAAQRLQES